MPRDFTNPIDKIPPDAQKETGQGSLQYLPVGLFGSTVSMAGLSIAWDQASVLF